MPFLPFRRIALDLRMPRDVAEARLRAALFRHRDQLVHRRVRRANPSMFDGRLGDGRFVLRPIRVAGNELSPIARGRIEGDRLRTHVSARLDPAVVPALLSVVWALFGVFALVALTHETLQDPGGFWPFLILGIVVVATPPAAAGIRFHREGQRLVEALRHHLAADVTVVADLTGVRRPILGAWQLILNGEPPERRFGIRAVVLVQVVGAIGFLTWVTTLGACSDAQFSDARYSCPSGGRIALIWALGAASAASTLFVAPMLMRRRSRRWYPAFLGCLVVVAALLVALLVHRPSWGVLHSG